MDTGEDILSCAIITMPANEVLAELYNARQRMPVILPPEAVDTSLQRHPGSGKEIVVPYRRSRQIWLKQYREQ